MNLGNCKIGSVVKIINTPSCKHGWYNSALHNNKIFQLIGLDPYSASICLGFNDDVLVDKGYGWFIPEGFDRMYTKPHSSYKKYKYGWLVPNNIDCELISEPYFSEQQKCVRCGISAPHIEPNYSGMFLCDFCQILDSI